ncbi:MAG: bifunctional methylenetetrahydrofolate dehydrogenase/methenyltetrahydrofolate cyclohydrolase FolD [Candidatus Marinimicrobia bacterium]|nr:bifunctional methylenetetrahydrofolate dehydrogenase/methenyltetrahydrofolate cyclohydrolase FolD [Candidatus Neomarinimicrobiota bacterium]MCF7828277.1 bifunctional methylenetetrahydrofolate dehydrogenase/methenyltetrahydrofolate cyclohydrolase FolD [Candidatus Neomarinimicrobiota bacterium]MCF7879548.1 bifunctional methylenetetrahydrofolate dehydrogenase/methenyltetrahydrofolate cyclohydrolase FolD [Candidatus Neomarinimicrobiota bacterium]
MAQAEIIDGKEVAAATQTEITKRIENLKSQGVEPGLTVIIVGEDPASQVYVRMKARDCRKVGIAENTIELPEDTPEKELLDLIDKLNRNPECHGILVQMPVPDQINSDTIIQAIDPAKDVDGLHPENVGKLVNGLEGFIPCTPFGVLKMLEYYDIETDGRDAVVVGRSKLVGKPIANLLYQKNDTGNATVTICHTHTQDLAQFTRRADILVVAAGAPNSITADMIKPHATVIDVGISRVDAPDTEKGYKLVGDVDFENAQKVAGYITPVPGGVGPMTRTMLLHNTVRAAERTL